MSAVVSALRRGRDSVHDLVADAFPMMASRQSMVTATHQQSRIRNSRFLALASEILYRKSIAAYLITLTLVGSAVPQLGFADDATRLVMPPAVVHAYADEPVAEDGHVIQVVGKQIETRRSAPSRPMLMNANASRSQASAPSSTTRASRNHQPDRSYVAPAAGILESIFGGQTPRKAKKEHEDGRKATALPPPDPSFVNWDGIPYHQTKRPATDGATAQEPIRDQFDLAPMTSGTTPRQTIAPVPSSTANLRRAPGTTSTQGQPISATNRNLNYSIPPVPLSQTNQTPLLTAMIPSSSSPTAQYDSELSSSDSTRRTGRKVINALVPESMVVSPNDMPSVPSSSVSLTEPLPAPSVPRRELLPIETSVSSMAKVASPGIEAIPEIPKPSAVATNNATAPVANAKQTDIPPVPMRSHSTESLDDSWNSIGSGLNKPATKVAAVPVSTPPAPGASPTAVPVPAKQSAVVVPKATVPVPPSLELPSKKLANDIDVTSKSTENVSDAFGPSGPSAKSERALRDALVITSEDSNTSRSTRSNASQIVGSPLARKSDSSVKQLGVSELPGIRVVTEGPPEIMIRELTQYEVRVENRGSFDANGLIVRSSLPPGAEVQGSNASIGTVKTIDQSGQAQLQWTIEKLPAGVVERLFIRVIPGKAGAFDVATDWTTMPQKHLAKVTVREPKLSVVIDGPDEIIYGRSEKYRVRVMNPGDGDASNVVFTLAPDSNSPQSQKIGSIPAGKEAQFEIELTAREQGELKIGGVAIADREVKTTANKSIRIASAIVEAELTGPPLKYQNTNANYRLSLTNTGKAVCEAMEAELRLPPGVTYVSGIPQSTLKGDRLVWSIDAMQPGAVRNYELVCKMERTGDMMIGFNCSGSASGRASVSIETRVEAIADLVLTINRPAAPAPVNSDVTYEMIVVNRGSKAAQDVRVIAQFSDGIEPVRVEGHLGEVVTGQALFSPIPQIEPGSTVRLKVMARADRAGDHRFRAEVRHGEISLVAEEATMFMEAPAERISRRSTDK